MSEITRICAQCGKQSALDAQFCPHCGYDMQAGLPAPQNNRLPMVIGKAALPILAGVASLAVRAGWKLLKDRLLQNSAQPTRPAAQPLAPRPTEIAAPRQARRTIRIRSAWAVGDASGVWRRGSSEHTIEIDE